MQFAIKPLGYHIALGGGVLNNGVSTKDLDLYFLPLTNDKAPDAMVLWAYVASLGFDVTEDDEASHVPNPYTPFRIQHETRYQGKRVDVFVV